MPKMNEPKRVRWNDSNLLDICIIGTMREDSIDDVYYNSADIDGFELKAVQDELLDMNGTKRMGEVALAINRWMTEEEIYKQKKQSAQSHLDEAKSPSIDTEVPSPPDYSCPPALPKRYISDEISLESLLRKTPSTVNKNYPHTRYTSTSANRVFASQPDYSCPPMPPKRYVSDEVSISCAPAPSIMNKIYPCAILERHNCRPTMPRFLGEDDKNNRDNGNTTPSMAINTKNWYGRCSDNSILDDDSDFDDAPVKLTQRRQTKNSDDTTKDKSSATTTISQPYRRASLELQFPIHYDNDSYSEEDEEERGENNKGTITQPCHRAPIELQFPIHYDNDSDSEEEEEERGEKNKGDEKKEEPCRRASIELQFPIHYDNNSNSKEYEEERGEKNKGDEKKELSREYAHKENPASFVRIPVLALGLSLHSARHRLSIDVAEKNHYYKAARLKKIQKSSMFSSFSVNNSYTSNDSLDDSISLLVDYENDEGDDTFFHHGKIIPPVRGISEIDSMSSGLSLSAAELASKGRSKKRSAAVIKNNEQKQQMENENQLASSILSSRTLPSSLLILPTTMSLKWRYK